MTIKIEDLTPGTVVRTKPVKIVRADAHGAITGEVEDHVVFLQLFHLEAIIETPEAKIVRLERELAKQKAILSDTVDGFCRAAAAHSAQLAERDARIAELTAQAPEGYPAKIAHIQKQVVRLQDQIDGIVASLTDAPNPLIGEPTCYDEDMERLCGGGSGGDDEPTTPVWSDPIEGPPNPRLPVGSFSVYGGPDDRGDVWLLSLTADDPYSRQAKQHRTLMHQPIQWEGGERPVPMDWWCDVRFPGLNGVKYRNAQAYDIDWSRAFTFTLTSTGGGNG